MKWLTQIKAKPERKGRFVWSWKKKTLDRRQWHSYLRWADIVLCVCVNNMLYFLWSVDSKTEIQKYHMVFPLLLEAPRVSEAPVSAQDLYSFIWGIYPICIFYRHLSSIRIQQICYRNWFTLRFLNLGSYHTLIWTKTHEYTFIVTCGLNSLLGLAKATEEIARPGYVQFFIVIGETKKCIK